MILVTGGAGYIGSHTVLLLLEAGHDVLIIDNLGNSSPIALERIASISGRRPEFVKGDVRDRALLDKVFAQHRVEAVIHFAGLKAVGESVAKPLYYYDNNVSGALTLLQSMMDNDVDTFVFSSSATVYGDPTSVPISESALLNPANAYGQTKLHIEDMLRDINSANPSFKAAILRYFNPVGAHPSGLIGEDPLGVPNNLLPYIAQVAVGRRESLQVFGDNYPTRDGTGVRDYIHVMDLAAGHLAALDFLRTSEGFLTANLGTGVGCSVLEVVRAFERVAQRAIPYQIGPRRAGDVAECYADVSFAQSQLNWAACHDLEKMCEDHWNWQKNNPDGYQ